MITRSASGFAEPKPASTSTSRQFVVYGADVRLRGDICALAEQIKTNLLRLLRLNDGWKTPLLINLDRPQANLPEAAAAYLDLGQTGFGLKLQLNIIVEDDLDREAMQHQLLRAILIEMIYRVRPDIPAGTAYVNPPDWLVDGVLQLDPARDRGPALELLRSLAAEKRTASLDDVVRQKRDLLDPSLRPLYAGYSMALVRLLVDAPNGRVNLVHFINDLPDAPNDPFADLCAHFPAILGRKPERWWSRGIARFATNGSDPVLTAAKTAANLDQLLKFSVPDRSGGSTTFTLNDSNVVRLPVSARVLRQRARQLLLLAAQAHPSYRAVVQEYGEITALLARNPGRRVRARLAHAAGCRRSIERQLREIGDYLNWYEATQPGKLSGAFTRSLAGAGSHDSPPRRRDAISVYLDAVEMQTE